MIKHKKTNTKEEVWTNTLVISFETKCSTWVTVQIIISEF